MKTNAIFSPCRAYRYTLTREWDQSKSKCVFIGLNPSTADETQDDPTIRRCIGYAKTWGYGGLLMLNIFALRSTDPMGLRCADDPIGPLNDKYISESCYIAPRIIAAWGAHGEFMGRGMEVREYLCKMGLMHLGLTKLGHPKHPLYLRKDIRPKRWDG